jgi:hypothetical protein
MEALVQATRSAYYLRNATYVIGFANLDIEQVLKFFLDPIQATEINLQPTNHGDRVFYNTISMVMPILQQFFFIMALNGISAIEHAERRYRSLHYASGCRSCFVVECKWLSTFFPSYIMADYIHL